VKLGHLARRFFGSMSRRAPSDAELEWVATVLTPEELTVWTRLRNADRRHSIAVARDVVERLRDTPYGDDSVWAAAALVHDCGKLDSGLGTYGRVVATVAGAAAGRQYADAWSTRRGFTRKAGLYLRHPELGADRLRLAGARELTAAWAAAHHDPSAWPRTPIPAVVITALHEADDD
jgi:hypothetical protein